MSDRFVDLFAGAGSVSHYVSENIEIPVLSSDLQHYSRYLVGSITERDYSINVRDFSDDWLNVVRDALVSDPVYQSLSVDVANLTLPSVTQARILSSRSDVGFFISRHYGGHYYSSQQAYVLDVLYKHLPDDPIEFKTAMAILLRAASACAASPGHTAQPFQPTSRLIPHIQQAWSRDVLSECDRQLRILGPRHALKLGEARTCGASLVVQEVNAGDLVFCDPPYSAVQYSRFYHVLEGIARGGWSNVDGAGRAPNREDRASSDYSRKSKARVAMSGLLRGLSEKKCKVILTFPSAQASNGLSGEDIAEMAREDWHVSRIEVNSNHSTLGGSSGEDGRGGRRSVKESVVLLKPRRRHVGQTLEIASGDTSGSLQANLWSLDGEKLKHFSEIAQDRRSSESARLSTK